MLTTPLPFRAFKRWSHRAIVSCAAAAAACGPKAASSPAPAPAPAAAAAPTWLTCPDPTDGPSIVFNAIDEAHRAWVANPATTQLPPACVYTAFARVAGSASDSVNIRALALAMEASRRTPDQRELLAAEVVLLARARRYADVTRTYDRLVTLEPQPAIDVARVAIAAARQRADTATLVRLLSKTMDRPDAGPLMKTEYNILRQKAQLWAAINEARGLLRQNPRYVTAYPSVVGNFGTLGLADSVASSLRRALAAGAARQSLSASVETLVSAMLRHATLYGSTYGWEAPIASAIRVDSVLSSPSTKFLIAVLTLHSVEARTVEVSALVGTPSMSPPADAAVREELARRRAAGCQRVPELARSISIVETRMREGGERYAGGGVAQVNAGLSAAREKVASLQDVCARP